ncbi:hypothetical protein CCAX7_45920 [Capsulimonas corticalis]|uniref:Uncharacterized protein n=1 Tax=Capsulimonas corticalis TaxID=2219043 RepID=A0A402D5D7_9BACT|nr:basic secretory protein-like protein [Capsulimonas corticalis]BDI32541.1 hypothetical protein CCAX7_45920 [Capsulimonas corticalis]
MTSLLRRAACVTLPGLLLMAAAGARAASPTPGTAEALIYSTMPSTAAHRPEMALDGDPKSYYKTVYGMDDGDTFLVLLSRPIPVRSLHILTGDAEGQDGVTQGVVETSVDGVQFTKAAAFDANGAADAKLDGKLVEAIRIRLNDHAGVPSLMVREITIDSPVKVSHVQQGPGRGFVDISQAPDLADWAKRAETQMEAFWADTAALLYTDDFITPNMVNVVYKTGPGVTDVAATGGGVMVVNSKWCREHPDDTGLTVHETAHVIQAMSSYNPVWLIEGTADYIRWVKFEPQNFHPRINVLKAKYTDRYQTTATFLGWCELHYDSGLVTKLNRATRLGNYDNSMFKQYCGKDIDTLWAEFIEAYKADPVNIITKPVAEADKPRVLPVVTKGTSAMVDLSPAFNTTGVTKDGAKFSPDGGADSGGASYSGTLLGMTQSWKDVTFVFASADAPDMVSCQGQTVSVAPGQYQSLWLVGAAVDGSQMAQHFIVNYTDGSTADFAQNVSDWFQPSNFPGESRVVKMAYRNLATGEKDPRTFYAYSYGFSLNHDKTVKSITLTNNPSVRLLAATLAN